MKKILLLDNYDSFTYNLVQILEELVEEDQKIVVKKNDEISVEEVSVYDKIVLSPGPGIPSESGILIETIKKYAGEKPIFGVCLGLQAIVEAFGGELFNLEKVHHGVQSKLEIKKDSKIFQGLENPILIGRYHSWVASKRHFPSELDITGEDENGIIMSIENSAKKIYAVQFHPESIMTPQGKQMIRNWLSIN